MARLTEIVGTQGRMGRLACVIWCGLIAAGAAGMAMLAQRLAAQGGLDIMLARAITWAAVAAGLAAAVVVLGRRLHDLGRSAANLAWILPLGVAAATIQGSEAIHDAVEVGMMIFAGLVGLWLLLWPGEAGGNDYGPRPG
jgi:uncharacterized membrane protein YhaH (DUF805 family)